MPPPRKPTANPINPTPKPMPSMAPAATAPSRSEVKGSSAPKPASAPRQITSEQIAQRAFEIYAGRGYAPGDQNADWYEAERQLKAGL